MSYIPLSHTHTLRSLCMVCLQDQHDVIERHTQSGLDLLERYVKFVKDRAEVEQNYAKQLRFVFAA